MEITRENISSNKTKDLPIAETSGIMDRIVFGWWNTSLSPVGLERSDEKHREVAAQIVKSLIENFQIDCLAPGEVSNSDLTYLRDRLGRNLAIYEGTLRQGRLQFDTGVLYNPDRFVIENEKSIISSHGESRACT